MLCSGMFAMAVTKISNLIEFAVNMVFENFVWLFINDIVMESESVLTTPHIPASASASYYNVLLQLQDIRDVPSRVTRLVSVIGDTPEPIKKHDSCRISE